VPDNFLSVLREVEKRISENRSRAF